MVEIFSKCGMNCGKCPWSRYTHEAFQTDEELQHFLDRCKEILGYRPEKTHCVTCQTPDEDLPHGAHVPLRSCLVRECVNLTGIENCAYCSRFPCGYIKRQGTEWTREKLEAKRGPMEDEDYFTFVEPFEGLKHLTMIRAGVPAEAVAEPVIVPPLNLEITGFPEEISVSEQEKKAYRALYQLLSDMKCSSLGLEDVDLYAQQKRLRSWIQHVLRFMWILGRFGTPRETKFSIDSKDYMNNRGTEKSLGILSFAENVFKVVKEFGIHVEYILTEEGKKKGATTPTGYLRERGWSLVVSVDQTVNDQILKALHTYAGALDKKYGNKAFQHFSRADMHVLAE